MARGRKSRMQSEVRWTTMPSMSMALKAATAALAV